MRLIDADALIVAMLDHGVDHVQTDDLEEINQIINDAPTVDAVPVVRYGECKFSQPWYADKSRCFLWHESGIDVFNDGYCSYGKRKEDA